MKYSVMSLLGVAQAGSPSGVASADWPKFAT